MIKNLLKIAISLILFGNVALAQQGTGAIKGKITDAKTKEGLPFVSIIAIADGNTVAQGQSDFEGNYTIRPLKPGKYTIKTSFVGYQAIQINEIVVGSDNSTFQNIVMSNADGIILTTVNITDYVTPSISENGNSVKSVTKADFQAMAAKDLGSVAATSSGVTRTNDKSGALNIRGARTEGAFVYLDGERILGSSAIPQGQVEQIDVITSGIPARYGNTTGGIVNITSSGASSKLRGGVEIVSSQLTDAFDYNQINGNISGPIIKKINADKTTRTILGFNVGAQFQNAKDPSPSIVGAWKVNDQLLDSLRRKPLAKLAGSTQLVNSAEYLKRSDLEHIKARPNVASQNILLNGRLEWAPSKNSLVTVGGSYTNSNSNDYVYTFMLLTSDRNTKRLDNTARGFIKFNQKIGIQSAENSSQNVTNINFSAQLGYQVRNTKSYDPILKYNHFQYGYIGKFDTRKTNFVIPSFIDNLPIPAGVDSSNSAFILLPFDSLTIFTPNYTYNPFMTNYTQSLYDAYNGNQFGVTNNIFTLQANNGLINGSTPGSVYALFQNTGRTGTGSNKTETKQLRAFTSLTMQLFKYHDIEIGGEFEQQTSRFWGINGTGLWARMRQLVNQQTDNGNLNFNSVQYLNSNSTSNFYELGTVYTPAAQTDFDKALRNKLGITDDKQVINIDNLNLDAFSLDLFTAEELLNPNAGQLVGYYGYDKDGNKLSKLSTINDYLNNKDANGKRTFENAAFRPIYAAGYIQDKFEYKDLRFNLGFRLDYYNSLQYIVKDPYTIFPAKTVADITDLTNVPTNIESDFVAYVNTNENANGSNVIGFRDPNSLYPGLWYDRAGKVLQNPLDLARQTSDGRIAPFLVDNKQKKLFTDLKEESFARYQAQYSPMPRLSFAFPISDVASFHAHYDVLYTRPNGNRFDIFDLYNLENQQAPDLENPNLRPEKTTDLEIGYAQVLNESKSAGLELKVFYKDFNNQIEKVNLIGAYPKQYSTYANSGFGTSKGLTGTFNLQRTGNFKMSVNYTLQFTKGTGSDRNSANNFVNLGVPNLRNLTSLTYDQRHNLVTSLDFRYGEGTQYNGPKIGDKNILENFGVNVTSFVGSGTPYTKQKNATTDVTLGVVQRSQLEGAINGARKPWTYRFDARIEKLFAIKYKGETENSPAKKLGINAYVLFQNILNNINVVDVYNFTGSPSDDGFLSAASSQAEIASKIDVNSYRELYAIKVNNPDNYGLPRIIRLGLQINF